MTRRALGLIAGAVTIVMAAGCGAAPLGHPAGGGATDGSRHAVTPSSTSSTPSSGTAPGKGAPTVTIVEIGDSLGEDLGYGLQDVLGHDPHVHLVTAAKGDSGLAEPQFYDWPHHLASLLVRYRPGIVVVFLGANDVESLYRSGTFERFGTAAWRADYGRRVATVMDAATAAGARVVWVGMPVMRSARFSTDMRSIDDVFSSEAASHRGVTFFPSWSLFSGPTGGYVSEKTGPSGQRIALRDPDGIHLTLGNGSGSDLLATAVVRELRRSRLLPASGTA